MQFQSCTIGEVTQTTKVISEFRIMLLYLIPGPRKKAKPDEEKGQDPSVKLCDRTEKDSNRHDLSLETIRKQSGGAFVTISLFVSNVTTVELDVFGDFQREPREGCRLFISHVLLLRGLVGTSELRHRRKHREGLRTILF